MKQNNFSDYTKKMNNLLDISIDNICVLTVDMQNEYLNPKYGTSPLANDDIESITKNTNDFLMKMRKNDVPIIHCYVVRRKEELNHNFFISPYIVVPIPTAKPTASVMTSSGPPPSATISPPSSAPFAAAFPTLASVGSSLEANVSVVVSNFGANNSNLGARKNKPAPSYKMNSQDYL